ncbi:MAG: sigma-70 family RNA polymerase sigma factor [Bryobacteraceae bacterium]
MDGVLADRQLTAAQGHAVAEVFGRESRRLRNFIRKRVPGDVDAEDILQDVFYELVEAWRLMKPVAHTGAWLFQVARNRIADLFRGKKPELVDDAEALFLRDLLPSPDAGPDLAFARRLLLEEIEIALSELPESQREVFIAHELEGRSFRDLAAETGTSVRTLLSRKHYAVLHLRRRLQSVYNEFTRTT